MDVKLEDGTWGKTEKTVKVGEIVTLEICDDDDALLPPYNRRKNGCREWH